MNPNAICNLPNLRQRFTLVQIREMLFRAEVDVPLRTGRSDETPRTRPPELAERAPRIRDCRLFDCAVQ